MVQVWRRVPQKRDWSSFCQGILVCADIEFSDGVILNIAFNSRKFQMLTGQLVSNMINSSAIQLQLAWLCYRARRCVYLLRRGARRIRRKKQPSKLLDDFKFGTAANSISIQDSDFSEGFQEGNVEDSSINTDITDVTFSSYFGNRQTHSSGHTGIASVAHTIHPKTLSAGDEVNDRTLCNVTESGINERNTFPGSDLESESAQELHEIRNHLDNLLLQVKGHSPQNQSHEAMMKPYIPNASMRSSGSEVVVDEVHSLQHSVNLQLAMVAELKQQFEELKQKASQTEQNISSESVYSVFQEDKEELRKELHSLRDAQAKYEQKTESVMSKFLLAMERTSQLAEEMKESSLVDQSMLIGSGQSCMSYPEVVSNDMNSSVNSYQPPNTYSEYERLKAKVEKDQMEKDVDISFLKLSIDKLARGLKQSKVQYDDLETESKRQHDKLKQELLRQRQEYMALQKKMHDLEPKQQLKKQTAAASKTLLDSLPNKAMDDKFQIVLDHEVSKGNSLQVEKLREYKSNANRKVIYNSLVNGKHLDLLRSIGVPALKEREYSVATLKDKLDTLKKLQQIKRVSRFLNFGALRWRLQASDPSYTQLALSFVDILSTNKSASTLRDALLLGVRLRHEDLTVLALDQIYKLLTQAYEKNKKFFVPTLFTLLGDVSYLALVMRVFFMSPRVQLEGLQVIACIFVSSRTPEELEINLNPQSSGLFESTIRVLLWHCENVDLCMNAVKVAKRFVSKCQQSKEKYCSTKQIKAILAFATKSVQSVELFDDYVSFVSDATSESLPLVLKFSEGGLSSQFSLCLNTKYNDEAIISIIAKAILSLFSTHGPIFIQEMFGNKEFFQAILKCLSFFADQPKMYKLIDMCFLAVCGQNLRIISRIPEKEIAVIMVNILDDEELNALLIMPTLMTINAACLSEAVLKEFHANNLHFIIKRVLFDSNITEVREYAIKTHRIIADVDPVAKLVEEEKEEQLRIEKKQAEQRRVAEIEAERQRAAELVLELEKGDERVGQVKNVVTTEGIEVGIDAIRIRARQEAEKKAQLALENDRAEEIALAKAEEEEEERRQKAAEVDKLRQELREADEKALMILRQQEAERKAHEVSTRYAIETVVMEMFDEEMEKIALKEIKRENVRLEKEQVEKEAAARIADMKAQFDAAERSALLSVELEKAERKAQLQAEREEAERENLAREKQEAADKIAQELILEDMNRKSKAIDKAKGGRMIQRILSQQLEVVSREEHLERVSPNRSTQNLKSSVGAEGMDQIDDTSNNDEKRQQEFTASKINETPDFGRGVRDNMEGERVIGDRNQATVDDIKSENSPADIDNANAKVTEEDEILLQKEKAAKKQKRKEEKEAAFLAKVAAKREAKKQAKRKARMDEIKRKEDERTPPSLAPLVDN